VHITAVGADDPTKAELPRGCLRRADRLVVDSRELARHGELARAGIALEETVELGEVISGDAAGRQHDREITICKLIGLGVQDLAAAELTLTRLRDPARVPSRPSASVRDFFQETR
jgi:ornithine cyclodeaminase